MIRRESETIPTGWHRIRAELEFINGRADNAHAHGRAAKAITESEANAHAHAADHSHAACFEH